MASEDDDGKTEAPSGRLLSRAWQEGDVPLGRDLPLVASLVASVAALVALGGTLRGGLVHALGAAAGALAETPFRTLPHLIAVPALAAAGVCAAAAAGSALVTLVQTKGGFWADRWLPDLSRVARPGKLMQMWSRQMLADLGVAAVKVVALGWAAWTSVPGDFLTLPGLLAAALLVNPTHIAIALRYRRDEGRAPRVIAKGKGELAEYMRELARENAIPIVQDIPLAR